MTQLSAAPAASAPATILGRYRIERELGRGAQGRVYLAEDTLLARRVAIKTLRAGRDSKRAESLIAEARTISQLSHPNIVTLFDVLEDNGAHCVVLEYVEGRTLEHMLQSEGRMQPKRAIAIAVQTLQGLAFAHERGIVHRDIKPGNILIDAAGTARIMDFGIAAAVGYSDAQATWGTPRYMAPESFDNRDVARNADVFSVGMTLYEMLTGRPAVEGRNVFEILHKIANESLQTPSTHNPEVDEGLDQIVMRALAKDPAARYADAGEMRIALEHYLQPAQPSAEQQPQSSNSAIDFLLHRMRHKSSFPALSHTISAINRITTGEAQSVQALTDVLLKDFALTNKLLRLVNSSGYGQFGGTISTVSRAVMILGFDAVRNLAITLVLVEHLQNKGQAAKLRDDVIGALFVGILARRVAKVAGVRDAEEGYICGVFHHLGRMLATYYLFDETVEIGRKMQQAGLSEEQAARSVLGASYSEIGIAVARSWNLPDAIVRSIERIPEDRPRKPHNAQSRLRVATALADALANAATAGSGAERDKCIRDVVRRFGAALPVDDRSLVALSADAVKEFLDDTAGLLGDSRKSRFCQSLVQTTSGAAGAAAPSADILEHVINATPRAATPEETPQGTGDAEQVLASGIQDITDTLVADFSLSDVLRIILETMYRAIRFSRVVLFMRDPHAPVMTARLGYGDGIERILGEVKLPIGKNQDVFSVVLEKNVDVLVSDVAAENIRTRIPEWFRKSGFGDTFVLLPIVIDAKPIGLFYGEKPHAGELAIAPREMNLLKTLRNQAVLALKQRR